jgi:hypothetical protein
LKALGLIERGGGHPAAVGLVATNAQIAPLQSAGLTVLTPQVENAGPEYEIFGELDELTPGDWVTTIERLEPFGRGNPVPRIARRSAVCLTEAEALTLKDSGKSWGGGSSIPNAIRSGDGSRLAGCRGWESRVEARTEV